MKKLTQKTNKMPQINQGKIMKNLDQKNLSQKWNWIQSIRQGQQQTKENKQIYNLNFKLKKKTKFNQINYEIEDLEEKNRRIQQVMQYVDYCNQQLKEKLDKENLILGKIQQKLSANHQKQETGNQQSLNFLKNLEREQCDLIAQLQQKQNQIKLIENTNQFYEFKEQQVLQEILQNEIANKSSNLKNYKQNNCNKSKIQKLQKQLQDIKSEIKNINSDIQISKKEIKVVKQKKKLIQVQKVKEKQKNNEELLNDYQIIQNRIEKNKKILDELKQEQQSQLDKNQQNLQSLYYVFSYIILNQLDFYYIQEIQDQLKNKQNKAEFIQESLQVSDGHKYIDFFDVKFDVLFNKLQAIQTLQIKKQKLKQLSKLEQDTYKLDEFVQKVLTMDISKDAIKELIQRKRLNQNDFEIQIAYQNKSNTINISKKVKQGIKTPQKQQQVQKNKTEQKQMQSSFQDSFQDCQEFNQFLILSCKYQANFFQSQILFFKISVFLLVFQISSSK